MNTLKNDVCNTELEDNIDFDFFSALFEPTRVDIVKLLAGYEFLTVQEIANHFPQDRSVISRHLKILCDQDVILANKDGRYTRYSLNQESLIRNFDKTLNYLKQESCI